jgi:hypothetical protein
LPFGIVGGHSLISAEESKSTRGRPLLLPCALNVGHFTYATHVEVTI